MPERSNAFFLNLAVNLRRHKTSIKYFLSFLFQVVKPVNLEALSKWVGHIPDDVVEDMAEIAPMLSKFGYDPNANPPTYGKPDEEVIHNEEEIKRNKDEWDERGELVKKLSKKETAPRGR